MRVSSRTESEREAALIQPFFSANRTNLLLQAAQAGHSMRHRAIVNNIANVDTPGYHRVEVEFERDLQKAAQEILRGAEQGNDTPSAAWLSPAVRIDRSRPLRADGSNVSIDREMADLADNASHLSALTELMIRNYRDLKAAISGR
jgi:flagellar basal-body rod protein FlgB